MPWIPTKFPAPDGRRASKSPCANQYVPRRPSPPHPQPCGTTRNAITTSAKRHRHTVSNTNAKRGRPRGRGLAALQISCPDHRSSSATILENRSPWRRWLAEWATSMRPRESEGSRRRTTMTKGKSGARAPDRNRGRPLRKPPPPGATYEEPPSRQQQHHINPNTTKVDNLLHIRSRNRIIPTQRLINLHLINQPIQHILIPSNLRPPPLLLRIQPEPQRHRPRPIPNFI